MPLNLAPYEFLPDRDNCALLVIDIQERLAAIMPPTVLDKVVRNTRILIQTAQEFGLPVVVSEHYPKGLGSTAQGIIDVLPNGIKPVEKVEFSCCKAPNLQPVFLEQLPMHNFILCGMETHICVLHTALDLLQRNHRVYIAADAVCSREKLNWKVGLSTMQQAGAVLGTTEMFAFGLLGAAGTEQFKRIYKLIK